MVVGAMDVTSSPASLPWTRAQARGEAAALDLYGEWAGLAERTGASPFAHPGWIGTWADAFGGGPLSVQAVRRDGRLVAIAPFYMRPTGIVSPTNWHTPEFGLVAEDAQARDELAAGLVERARHRLDVSFLSEGSGDLRAVREAADAANRLVVDRTIQRSMFVEIDGDWDGYKREVGSKVLREVRRRRRKLESEGEVTVEFHRPGDDLEELLEQGYAVEGSGWKDERGTAIASRPETRRFYTDVARWAAERGWLVLAFLRLDGRVAAFDLCLEYGSRSYVLKGGYDPAFRAFGPRTLLLHDSLERAFEHGMRSYEFLGADEEYKRRWATGAHVRRRIQAFPRTVTGRAGYAAWTAGRSAGRRALALREQVVSRVRE